MDSAGRSIIVSDGRPPVFHDPVHHPGFSNGVIWGTDPATVAANDGADPTAAIDRLVPSPGETVGVFVEIPPRSARESPDYDSEAARRETAGSIIHVDDYIEDERGFHATPSVDYHVMLAGELWLVLDDGVETPVRTGDVVVQNGTRHTWENRSEHPARYVTVLVGARPA